MSFTLRVLTGLVAGLALGIIISVAHIPWLLGLPSLVEPVGLLFINAIRMTVIPLVVASLIVGVASAGDASTIGRLGGRSVLLFLVLVLFSCVFAAAIAYPLLGFVTIDPAVAASLRAGAQVGGQAAATTARQLPGVAQWVVDLVPVNVFKAASDGTMLPLIVFSVAFGVALTKIAGERRQAVLSVFRGVADAMVWLVGWVLTFAPIGVFALAVPLAARMGLAAAGALASYILLLSAIAGAFVLVIYPIAVVFGRVSPGAFARAAAPAQAVAFTSRASLAALPASFEGAKQLGLSESFSAFFLPLAASMFRVGGAIAQVVGVLFLARLYDVALAPMQVVTVVIVGTLTSFTIPGIPAGAIIVMAPVLVSVGVPAEGIGILVGVDTIPDMFRTTANVTAWMGGAAILGGRGDRNSEFTIQNAEGPLRK